MTKPLLDLSSEEPSDRAIVREHKPARISRAARKLASRLRVRRPVIENDLSAEPVTDRAETLIEPLNVSAKIGSWLDVTVNAGALPNSPRGTAIGLLFANIAALVLPAGLGATMMWLGAPVWTRCIAVAAGLAMSWYFVRTARGRRY